MRDEDKPFICTRKGRWTMQISPRNRAGWLWLTLWVVAFLGLAHGVVRLASAALGEGSAATIAIVAGVGARRNGAGVRAAEARARRL